MNDLLGSIKLNPYFNSLNADVYSKLLKSISIVQLKENSIVEILSHPGEHNLRKTNFSYTRQRVDEFLLSKSRLLELIALTNKELLTYIKSRNFKLTTFAGLKS